MTVSIIKIHNQSFAKIRINKKGEVIAEQLGSGIHATYHTNGHNHFYDSNTTSSWKDFRFSIALKIAEERGYTQEQAIKFAKKHATIISCAKGIPISEIKESVEFIRFGNVGIYLVGDGYQVDDTYISIFPDSHPRVFCKILPKVL